MNYEQQAQLAAEARLEALDRVQAAMCEGEEPEPEDVAVLAGPCCEGCVTCTVREVLDAAWPALRQLAVAEAVTLLDAMAVTEARGSRDFGRGYAHAVRVLRASCRRLT